MAAKLSACLQIHFINPPSSSDTKHPVLSNSRRRRKLNISCNSSDSPPKVAEEHRNQRNGRSLSEQLKPLSTTLLYDQPKQTKIQSKPKPTWVNPTRPRPPALSLHRQNRSAYSYNNPQLRDLKIFAKKMNEPGLSEDDFLAVLEEMPVPLTKENALLLLNNMINWEKSLLFFKWIRAKNQFPLETIFYNVVMKSLRSGWQFGLMEELALEMVQSGVGLDNITYSTIITGAKRCKLSGKAIEWFERMYKTGLMPDEVTYSSVLDVYAQLGEVEEVMNLYERGRASGWTPDNVAFSVLAKVFGSNSDYDGIRFVLSEMKELEVKPNLVVYNTLLEALGKVSKPGLAKFLFEEMLENGVEPNEKTLTFMIKIYGKARWGRDALELWERMESNGWPKDIILYNTLLSMCADLGLVGEAERLFGDMKGLPGGPDSWSYTAMLNIYASAGAAGKALALFEEISEVRVDLNVMGCTCLVQCLGKAKRFHDLVRVFYSAMDRGIRPDDKLSGSLLSVLSYCDVGGADEEKVFGCLLKANPGVVAFLKLLLLGQDSSTSHDDNDSLRKEFREILGNTSPGSRRPFCNCLIDICRKRNLGNRAHELLYAGTMYGLYPGLHSKTPKEWCLNVQSLSVGAAQTAFEEWMVSIVKMVEREEPLPEFLTARTGAGTHKFSQGLAHAFALQVNTFQAPFEENTAGVFVANRDDLVSWVQSNAAASSLLA
ncbi:unnamed protein product [Cuscuta epithymum]|uniref:Smr domain-containing protein n=1 Tax=Cuscuta epithymum TaxID=186058 RepID=A0AAV0DJ81_9ASTE|nr:unnamed protein product [Cuscuta epithymum]